MMSLLSRGKAAFLAFLVAAAVTVPSVAAAAPPEEDDQPRQFDFETDEVTVDVLKPDASMIEVLQQRARQSLIRIRMDFVKEIVRSAEDI